MTPGPAVPPLPDEPCPLWEDGRHVFELRPDPDDVERRRAEAFGAFLGGGTIYRDVKQCECGAVVKRTELGKQALGPRR